MLSNPCLIVSFDWLDLIHGINLQQRLKRKVHCHWHLVVSVPFRLLKKKEEIARGQLNSKHGNSFCNHDSPIDRSCWKILSGTSLLMLSKLLSALKQENFVVVFISKSDSSLYASFSKTHIQNYQLSYGRTEVRSLTFPPYFFLFINLQWITGLSSLPELSSVSELADASIIRESPATSWNAEVVLVDGI